VVIGRQFRTPVDTNVQHRSERQLKLCRNRWVTVDPTTPCTKCTSQKVNYAQCVVTVQLLSALSWRPITLFRIPVSFPKCALKGLWIG